MICLVCFQPGPDVCADCRRAMRPSGGVRSLGPLTVSAAHAHQGPARILIRRLKYEGMVAAARPLAAALVDLVPDGTPAFVPIPRVAWRRLRFGTDPAVELARRLGAECGVAVVDALRVPPWWPRRAGRDAAHRLVPQFDVKSPVPPGAVLIDDVLTTGGTLTAAAAIFGGSVRSALTATVSTYTMEFRPQQGSRGARERA